MKIAVQLDHPSRLNPTSDTSFMLMEEAGKRGHSVSFYEAPSLSWSNGDITAPLTPITIDSATKPVFTLGETNPASLREVDIVLMRQDPPFDMSYITATHLLEHLAPEVKVWNNPASVRNAPEKLSILGFAQFMPPTLISRDPAAIAAFAEQHDAIVAKPLYGYGGRSVFKLSRGDSNLETLIEHWMEASKEPLMWQQFRPEVKNADKRVLFINGKVEAVFGRTPGDNSIRANMRVGGTPVKAELNAHQQHICDTLSPFLKQRGLMLAGIDLIGDFLTEINVTSPTGLRAAQKLYGLNLAATFWEAVEAAA
ncbi:MAG: glutathione synthase [Rickettsiales bacterium]